MQFCGQASLVDFFFCRLPRIAQIPLAIFRIRFEPKGACLCEDPARAMSLSRCAANLLAVKLVRVARGMEHGLELQAISPGLLHSALGEDDIFVLGPLRLAASELSLRKPTHAAKAAPVVCAASGFPVRRFVSLPPLCLFTVSPLFAKARTVYYKDFIRIC